MQVVQTYVWALLFLIISSFCSAMKPSAWNSAYAKSIALNPAELFTYATRSINFSEQSFFEWIDQEAQNMNCAATFCRTVHVVRHATDKVAIVRQIIEYVAMMAYDTYLCACLYGIESGSPMREKMHSKDVEKFMRDQNVFLIDFVIKRMGGKVFLQELLRTPIGSFDELVEGVRKQLLATRNPAGFQEYCSLWPFYLCCREKWVEKKWPGWNRLSSDELLFFTPQHHDELLDDFLSRKGDCALFHAQIVRAICERILVLGWPRVLSNLSNVFSLSNLAAIIENAKLTKQAVDGCHLVDVRDAVGLVVSDVTNACFVEKHGTPGQDAAVVMARDNGSSDTGGIMESLNAGVGALRIRAGEVAKNIAS